MIKNYTTEEDLKGFVPELENYLWKDNTDFSLQIEKAEQRVIADFVNKGFKNYLIAPNLSLRNSSAVLTSNTTGTTSVEDVYSRGRLVYNVTVKGAGNKTLTLQGSLDDVSWTDIVSVTITATGAGSILVTDFYRYYRIKAITTNDLVFTASLTESSYDLLFIYMSLYLILMSVRKREDDIFSIRAKDFRNDYNDLWSNMSVNYGMISSDEVVEDENINNASLTLTR